MYLTIADRGIGEDFKLVQNFEEPDIKESGIRVVKTKNYNRLRYFTKKGKEVAGNRGQALIPAYLWGCSIIANDSFYNVRVMPNKVVHVGITGWDDNEEVTIRYCGSSFKVPSHCLMLEPKWLDKLSTITELSLVA